MTALAPARGGADLGSVLRLLVLMAAAWLLAVAPGLAQAQPAFPALTGRVVDQANLLTAAQEQALTTKLEALETETRDQLVVVTVNSLQDREIEEYGYQLGRAWGIGQKETDSGVLLIVAPNERKVRVEVGYGLEPILTDAFSTLVIQRQILPAFREGDFPRGIDQGVDALITQLKLDPAEAQARAKAAGEVKSSSNAKKGAGVGGIVAVLLFFFVFSLISRMGGRRRRANGLGPILMWAALDALSHGSGRGGGGGGWGGGGGGGFGGGGGSFGGGGASGGW